MIDKEKVLSLIEDTETYLPKAIYEVLTELINKLSVYDDNNLPKGFQMQLEEQGKIIDDDTELLKECYDAMTYLCFLDSYETNKYGSLIDKLKERLGIND